MSDLSDFRTVSKVDSARFEQMSIGGVKRDGIWWHNISFDEVTGRGSYVMIMTPGSKSDPHRHIGMEEFYVLEGELIEFDGQVYSGGDFVSLRAGSQHCSSSPSGCKLLVTHHGKIKVLDDEEWEKSGEL